MCVYMGVSKNRGTGVPQNGWFIMEYPIKIDDWGYHYFPKHPYMYTNMGPFYARCNFLSFGYPYKLAQNERVTGIPPL